MRLRRLTIPVFMLLVPAYVCLAEEGAQKITREFEVDYDGTLTLKTERGAVRVSTGRGKQLKVVVTKKLPFGWGHSEELDEFLVEFEQSGDDVTVIGKYPGQSGWDRIRRRLQVRYEIIVPKAYNLDIETSGGSIEVAAIDGNVSAETSGGSIDLGYVKGTVYGRTSGGSVRLEGSGKKANLSTSGGGIRAGTVDGSLEAHTSGGSIDITEVKGALKAGTSGGSITAQITGQPQQDCIMETSGGSITVYLPDGIKADLDASTSGGKVWSDHPVTVHGRTNSRKLLGQLNGGGPLIRLHTSGGNIRILQH